MNRYLCALPPIILGLAFIFLISVLLSDITTVTIIAIPILIVIWAVFSSLSFAFIIVGRLKRIERESEEGEV